MVIISCVWTWINALIDTKYALKVIFTNSRGYGNSTSCCCAHCSQKGTYSLQFLGEHLLKFRRACGDETRPHFMTYLNTNI